MKILLVTYYFPPLNAVASLRTYAFAKYLQALGNEVTVLTAAKVRSPRDLDFPIAADGFRLVEAGEAQSAPSAGAARTADLSRQVKFRKLLSERVIGNIISSSDSWLPDGLRGASRLVARETFDVVLSSAGPISSHLVAARVKSLVPGIAWVADYRDLWSGNYCVPQPFFPLNHLQAWLERFLNRRADLLVTVSEPLRQIMAERYDKPAVVVENGFFPEDLAPPEEGAVHFPKRLTFASTGSIYPTKRDPLPFLAALKELIDERLISRDDVEVRFYGENTYRLDQRVRECGIADVVMLLPSVSRSESLAIQRASSGLIFLEADDPFSRGYLTGKLFEYLVAGPPIIAVGIGREHEAAKVISRTGTGFVCGNDVALLKEVIMRIARGERPAADWAEVERYRRDRLVEKLARYIGEHMAERNGHGGNIAP